MAPYVSESQGFAEHYSRSGEMLGVSRESHSVCKSTSPGGGGGSAPLLRRDWAGAATGPGMQAPTIRVIHIFAPKVIKTDVANFRSTVQRLTGRSKKSSGGGGGCVSQRRARTKTVAAGAAHVTTTNPQLGSCTPTNAGAMCDHATFSALLDQQQKSEQEVLQRLVGDACGADHLVRCNSMDSTYSMDSGNFSGDSNGSLDGDLQSPTGSFSFYPSLNRQAPYSLNEIPAPFFAGDAINPYDHPFIASRTLSQAHGLGIARETTVLPMPGSTVVDNNNMMSVLGFCDMDISSGLGSTLPLPDFPTIPPLGSSSGLYEMFMPPPLCRLSVQSPFQGANNFFEFS